MSSERLGDRSERLGDHVVLPSDKPGFIVMGPDPTLESIDQRLVMTNIMLDRVNHNLEKMLDVMDKFMEREW